MLCSLPLHREMFHDVVCAGGEVLAGLGDGVGVGDQGVPRMYEAALCWARGRHNNIDDRK